MKSRVPFLEGVFMKYAGYLISVVIFCLLFVGACSNPSESDSQEDLYGSGNITYDNPKIGQMSKYKKYIYQENTSSIYIFDDTLMTLEVIGLIEDTVQISITFKDTAETILDSRVTQLVFSGDSLLWVSDDDSLIFNVVNEFPSGLLSKNTSVNADITRGVVFINGDPFLSTSGKSEVRVGIDSLVVIDSTEYKDAHILAFYDSPESAKGATNYVVNTRDELVWILRFGAANVANYGWELQ